ncbi:phytanoyl-CoA dioxygenase [Sphingoaurantiacus capsulatus]|uniref:Phytanoyl-CoA dioxygenase n=1 Tax=Sphingoaurantiacus capsulatus TaxID=1771310 RepID=A0ABV7X5C9_9SPHN
MTDILDDLTVEAFMRDGFIRLDGAFPPELAAAAREVMWADMGVRPDDPAGWTQPVVRLGHYFTPPFTEAANTPRLHAAYDALVGAGNWIEPKAVGTFPVRFPSDADPGDAGWHIDVSFGTDAPDFFDWRANIFSKGRSLLLLLLFSDVGEDDAPTKIRVGSHVGMARLLAPAGEAGLTLRDLVAADFGGTGGSEEAIATGPAGTAYLCHPFLVHSAQPHRGRTPRFMAQPPLLPSGDMAITGEGLPPVAEAIRRALAPPAG